MNSPVSLGVSPAATSTPTGVFSQWFGALFPCTGTLGCEVYFAPPLFLLVYLPENVGPLGPPATASRDPPAAILWEHFKMSWRFLSLSLFFLSYCFFILFWLDVCFFLLVHTVDLSPSFLRITIGSRYIFLYFT